MSVWLVRAGGKGERQDFALDKGVAVIGWDDLPDLSQFDKREDLEAACREIYPDAKPRKIGNWAGQFWAFARGIQVGDIVALPLKGQDVVAFGKVTGEYRYRPDFPMRAKHTRPVDWFAPDVPRERFDQDILYSLGALMTVCQIQRNNAEERIRAVLEGTPPPPPPPEGDESNGEELPNLEESAGTQIRNHIRQRFAGHKLAEIIDAVLHAQGYQTEMSPPGPDGGVDIIAGRGPMGFDPPRLIVQVKATSQQQDIKVVRELKGVMKDFAADQGLFVSWSGFRRSVMAEARRQFFEIRLWDAGDVVEAVQRYYEEFPEQLKAELPLKRIWVLVYEDA